MLWIEIKQGKKIGCDWRKCMATWVLREDLSKEVTFEQRPKCHENESVQMSEKNGLSRVNARS